MYSFLISVSDSVTLNVLLLTGILLKGKYLDFSLKSVVKFNL